MKLTALFLFFCFALSQSFAQAQYQNVRISPVGSNDPEEVSIAINPTNPANLIVGANLTNYYYSNDGGLTWTQGNLASSYGVLGDPCVIYDATGNAFYGHLSNPQQQQDDWLDRIVTQRSTDGGKTWNNGSYTGLNGLHDQDKHWLIADQTSSQFRDRLYVSWTQFDTYGSTSSADSSRILFSYSSDHGTTWSTPVRVSDRAGDCIDQDNTVEGAVPAVMPNGDVVLSWSGPLGIMFDKSTDGGKTFGVDKLVSTQPGGWDFNVSGIYRANGMPITCCDISNSPCRGTLYIGWSDQRNGATNTDVFFTKSTDDGTTWIAPKKVNTDATGRQQFFTWMTVDEVTGNIYFVFYDRRATTGDATDVFMARSTDGGGTFTNFKVSATSFIPDSTVFFGDYINVTARNGIVRPIWMRMDGNDLSVWTAIVNDTAGQVYVNEEESTLDFSLLQNFPNPFSRVTDIPFTLSHSSHVEVVITNSLGETVARLADKDFISGEYHMQWNGKYFSGGAAPSGVYFLTMKTD